MSQVIIFQRDNNEVSVVVPAPEYADQILAIAHKDVPQGRAWRIINVDELPSAETRQFWRWTDSGPLAIEQQV